MTRRLSPRTVQILSRCTLTLAVSCWIAGSAAIAVSAASDEVFLDAPAPAGMAPSPTILKHRAARINFDALNRNQAAGDLLQFNLFPGQTLIGRVESVDRRSDTSYTVTGQLPDIEHSSFVLVVNQGVMVMNLHPGPEGLLEVRYLGDGLHDIRQVDEKQFPACGNSPAQAVGSSRPAPPADLGPEADAGDLFDVMVVYTPAARAAAGGTAAIEALITLGFTESNTAYQQSLITPRIRLVYKAEISYTESGDAATDLSRLTNPSDGYMDAVHSWRNTYGADLVCLWTEEHSVCGIAWLMTTLSSSFESSAFSVVAWDCATGGYTFSHEMGHNMGCAHDRENAGGQGLYSYSYGWRFNGTNSVQYRTIMAYAPGIRIQRFSNPNVSYYGTPTGVPVGNTYESYNALSINNAAYTIANFRQTVVPITNQPPTITTQPASLSVPVGGTATFWVVATGDPTLAYQWRTNGTPISGATLSNYTIVNVQSNHAATYSVVVTNNFGSITSSNAVLTVNTTVNLGEALDAPGLTWSSGGSGLWFGQTTNTHDGIDAAQSGTITDDQESWLETTLTGPTTLTFWWKVSSESGYDFLRFYTNNVEQFTITGEIGWEQRTVNIPAGTRTLRWRYTKDGSLSGGLDRGWVDQIAYVPVPTLASALDNPALVWNTSGDALWFPQTNITHDGVDAAQSGTITDLGQTILDTTVVGPVTVTFWWKVSSEPLYDILGLYLDGSLYPTDYISGEVGWTQSSVTLPAGSHLIEWVYLKDESFSQGQDRGWLDQVAFIAPSRVVSSSFTTGTSPQFQLQFTGALGGSYTIQASTNLLNWAAWTNLISTNSTMSVVDPGPTNYRSRFYRVQSP
jgi:hypothetical protein